MRTKARAAILKSALQVFQKKGFHAASMESIASRARVSKGLAYNYFASKEELLAATVDLWIDELAVLWKGIDSDRDARRALRLLLGRFCSLLSREPDRYRLYLAVFLEADYAGVIQAAARRSSGRARQIAQIRAASSSLFKRLGASDPQLEVFFFRLLTTGLAAEYIMSPRRFPLAALKKRILACYAFSSKRRPR